MEITATSPAIPRERHEYLKGQIRALNHAAHTWGSYLLQVNDSGSWQYDGCRSFAEWCRQFCPQSSNTIKTLLSRERKKLGQQLVRALPEAAATPEPPKPLDPIAKAQLTLTQITQAVSARRDINLPVVTVERVPEPLPAIKLPSDACVWIHRIREELERLMRETAFAANDRFRHCVAALAKVDTMIQPELGLGVPARQKSRGTEREIVEFCVNVGLTKDDGEWFFSKCQGCGWKNNGQPIVDWRGTVRAWEKIKVFPSQKNGDGKSLTGAEMMVRQKELESCESIMVRIKERYSSVERPWSADDKERFRVAKTRRDELKKLLGIVV